MTDLVLVADDLTGAADCAATMAARAATSIVLDAEGDWPAARVLAVDTDSRYCPADVAAERVARTAHRGSDLGARLFKKIDSTLRGNIAVELRAMAGVLGQPSALVVVAPAFPATGRTTVGGRVHVHGAPLSAQGREDDVLRLLRAGGLHTVLVPVEDLRDAAALAETFVAARSAGADAVVVDGELESHLALVAGAAGLHPVPLLLAGSGGLARAVGAAFADDPAHAPGPRRAQEWPGNVLFVVGSHAPVARSQVELLAGRPDVTHVVLDRDEARTASTLRRALATGHAVLTPDLRDPVRPADAPAVAARLARSALAGLDRVGTLVATGGETARAILVAADVDRLDVVGEREPGVVHSHVPRLGVDMVTKAGAFGDAGSLLRCLEPAPSHR